MRDAAHNGLGQETFKVMKLLDKHAATTFKSSLARETSFQLDCDHHQDWLEQTKRHPEFTIKSGQGPTFWIQTWLDFCHSPPSSFKFMFSIKTQYQDSNRSARQNEVQGFHTRIISGSWISQNMWFGKVEQEDIVDIYHLYRTCMWHE